MFNADFYPTPTNLAAKMAGMIDSSFSKRILEPSAGKGNLVEAIQQRFRNSRANIDCIEIEPELQALLVGKKLNVIDADFLTYQPTKQYDTIIMNPPFSNGVKHVLKAWEIIYNGDVIALLNAETLRNISSKERRLLAEIIKLHGEFEFIENAFIDAERKTGVEVVLIHLKKRNSVNHDYFNGIKEQAKTVDIDPVFVNQLAIPQNRIGNMVIAYNMAVDCKREAVLKDAEANYYASMILGNGSDQTDSVKESLNNFIDDLRVSAWRDVINLADFQKYATESVRSKLDANNEIVSSLEFTTANIKRFLTNLMNSYGEIIDECLVDVFDKLTRYHEENRVHIEGWKSNDYFFINKRVVLPRMVDFWMNGATLGWDAQRRCDDLDRVMGHISGKTDFISINSAVSKAKENGDLIGQKIESEFFYIRLFKKGTAHFYFKDLKLLEQFNLIVGRKRNWLPKEDKKVPEEFWLMNGVQT